MNIDTTENQKMIDNQDKCNIVSSFIDHLHGKGLRICQINEEYEDWEPVAEADHIPSIEPLIADFIGVNYERYLEERNEILNSINRV